jgi:hypothetical protein
MGARIKWGGIVVAEVWTQDDEDGVAPSEKSAILEIRTRPGPEDRALLITVESNGTEVKESLARVAKVYDTRQAGMTSDTVRLAVN